MTKNDKCVLARKSQMCCSWPKANRVNAETVNQNIEVREGRWLHVVVRNPKLCIASEGCGRENLPTSQVNGYQLSNERTCHLVVFFIHGVGGSSAIWNEQVEYFSNLGYRVVAPDILGHGGSATPQNSAFYTFTELSYDMFAVFDRFRNEKKNILVGHSYGCSFCAKIASQRPRQVSKMILISGGGPIPLNPPPCHFFCLPSIILACLKSCVIWRFQRMSFHGRSSQDKIHLSQAFKAPTHVLRAIMVGQRWNEGDEQLHSDIMVPTLLIYGNNDKLVTMEEEMHMNQTIYGSTLEVLDDIGHMVMLECSQRVNELIRQFLCRDVSTKSDQLITNQSEPGLDGAC